MTILNNNIVSNGIDITNFDYTRFLNYVLYNNLRGLPRTANQKALSVALICHYKVKFESKPLETRGEFSDRIMRCLFAIKDNKVERRTPEEVDIMVKKYFPRNDISIEAV